MTEIVNQPLGDVPEISATHLMETTEHSPNALIAWSRNHKAAIVGGAFVGSIALSFIASPSQEPLRKAESAVAGTLEAMAVAEVAWIGGAAICLGAVGEKIPKNPLKIKSSFGAIKEKASTSKTFRAGFWINTTAAVSEFAIPTAVVVTHLPVESWGILSFSLADLAITVAVRKAMLDGTKKQAS